MRTRRIAIGCRRSGSATTVVTAPSGLAGGPDPTRSEGLPFDLVGPPVADWPLTDWPFTDSPLTDAPLTDALPGWTAEPLPSRVPGTARATSRSIPAPAAPPPGDRDLTLADFTTGRRDLGWNDNPGWPAAIDWTLIANSARGHSPRHARRQLPRRAFSWTGAGILATVLLTVLVMTIGDLVG
jgi:hypothetical protein